MTEGLEEELFNDIDIAEEVEEDLRKLKADNQTKIKIIDGYINKLWFKRVWISTLINVCLVGSALYSGVIFIWAVIFTALFHIIDKHVDFDIHKLHQRKEYAKYG